MTPTPDAEALVEEFWGKVTGAEVYFHNDMTGLLRSVLARHGDAVRREAYQRALRVSSDFIQRYESEARDDASAWAVVDAIKDAALADDDARA